MNYLVSLLKRVPNYTRGGFGETLTDKVQERVVTPARADSKLASTYISSMQTALGIQPRKRTRRTARPVYCGDIRYGSRWEHNQDCNNPNCAG